jgi:hypothetical protein
MFKRKSKRKWQRSFIRKVFDKSKDTKKYYSKIILQNLDLINDKNEYLPKYLFKYYTPTSENILDIKNQRLWLSHPNSFNDPFDCNIGYDSEKFEKDCLLKFIEEFGCIEDTNEHGGFTQEDKNRIQKSYYGQTFYWTNKFESYSDAKWRLLQSKSKEFRDKVNEVLRSKAQQIDLKVEKLKNINIRIACFSMLDKDDEFHNQIVMWSHYADNHKGFCVEYDLEFLKRDIHFTLKYYEYLDKRDEFIKERNEAIIKAGLFPVEYTANRVNIPVTKLNQINFDTQGKIKYNSNIDELIYKTFVVKSSNWSYEKEWRIIIDEQIGNHFDNKIPFPYAKSIYLGCRADNELIGTMLKLGEELGIDVYLLTMDGKKFSLESIKPWSYIYDKEQKKWKNPYQFK